MTTASAVSIPDVGTIRVEPYREVCLVPLFRTVWQMPLRFTLLSLVLLVPCLWQPHIAAGDLASHAYNAWLVQLIHARKASGLYLTSPSTNVLFDYLLDGLTPAIGAEGAQRAAVAVAVLMFFWSAFALTSVITKRLPWVVTPMLAILAYGTVFNMGLFNYYVGGALSLAALAVLWNATFWDVAIALLLLVLAWLAQPLPVLWAIAIFVYVSVARARGPRFRLVLPAACIGALWLGRQFLLRYWVASWDWRQGMHATGADQSYMFGSHYRLISLAVAVVWAAVFLHLAREQGWIALLRSIPAQVYVLCVLGCLLLPYTILFPWYKAAFGGVPERVAWLAAVFMCALVVQVKTARRYGLVFSVIAIVYFLFLYSDARAINQLEHRVDTLISTLPPDQRVIGQLRYPASSGFDESMLLDRACIGKCFSFGNYEAATEQFRVHASPGNSIVAWATGSSPSQNRAVSKAQQFFASQPEGTLYFIHRCGNVVTEVCMQRLTARDLDALTK